MKYYTVTVCADCGLITAGHFYTEADARKYAARQCDNYRLWSSAEVHIYCDDILLEKIKIPSCASRRNKIISSREAAL